MPIQIKMPALSPTMEEGTLAKWLVKVGDKVSSGDIMAEIETDKATMEFEAVDEGTVVAIEVAEGTEGVKVGTVIATIAGDDDEDSAPAPAPIASAPVAVPVAAASAPTPAPASAPVAAPVAAPAPVAGERVVASPLAKRIAGEKGIDLTQIKGSGPHGRIIKADLDVTAPAAVAAPAAVVAAPAPVAAPALVAAPAPAAAPFSTDIPHEAVKLSGMRKTIARRLTEAKATVPHYYLTVDISLDKLLKLRAELNAALAGEGVKLSVNDLLIKALGKALILAPDANVSFAGDNLIRYSRADIAVAVSIPGGLITPIVTGADVKSISAIQKDMADLAARAKAGKLAPHEYQGGTASLSNLGMFGIKQFEAVINPPQGMIMAIGAGEKRPYVIDDALGIATVMSATGSFDHRAIDGAEGAQLMQAFKSLIEAPLSLVA
ncbi:MAG: pyruvate dehydrogenase complex dihydrolipoamide acetyltransferase [Novosphingobium sp.]|uniref:pyruvate dehydrogenase complex dihydrolipoamide acetyltransferase n=1 Tax=Novosphingobium sp. TaxID=1874826 RepID=UPI003016CE42